MTDPQGPPPSPVPEPRRPAPPPSGPGSTLRQLVRSQAGNRPGGRTDYLRGAAHLDRWFRDAVIKELAENPHRLPPPSFGMDLAAVLKECFLARREVASTCASPARPTRADAPRQPGQVDRAPPAGPVRPTGQDSPSPAEGHAGQATGSRTATLGPGPVKRSFTLLLLLVLVWALWNMIRLSQAALNALASGFAGESRHLVAVLLVLAAGPPSPPCTATAWSTACTPSPSAAAPNTPTRPRQPPARRDPRPAGRPRHRLRELRALRRRRDRAGPLVVRHRAGARTWRRGEAGSPTAGRPSTSPRSHARIRRELLRFGEGRELPGRPAARAPGGRLRHEEREAPGPLLGLERIGPAPPSTPWPRRPAGRPPTCSAHRRTDRPR